MKNKIRNMVILFIIFFVASCNHDVGGSNKKHKNEFNYIDLKENQFNNTFPILDNYQVALYAKKVLNIPDMQVANRQVDFIFHVSKNQHSIWEVQVNSVSIIPSVSCNIQFNSRGETSQVEKCSSKK